ncbi:MAG: OmpA family protein [Pseudomonadota bacterium]|mgnify:CR=1 FL=1
MKFHQLAVATILASSAMAAHAEFTVSPMIGYHLFDNDLGPEDGSAAASIALGYRVNPNVGLEARFGQSEPDLNGGGEARVQNTTLDAYYRFNADGQLQPYGLIGGGQARAKGLGNTFDTTIANVAVGAFYQLTDNLALRGELRGVQYVEDKLQNSVDGIASVGVLYGFGGKKEAPVVAPVVIPEPVAAVAPPVVADDDNDGVNNDLDKCPGTPTTVVVDENGCPKMLTETVAKEIRVLFDTNKSVVKPAFNAEIEAVAKLMKEYPTAKVEVQGHTDSRGSAELNDKLSQDRADAVAAVLTGTYGVEADRVSAKGYGAAQPVADNKTAEGQTANRRVVAVAQGEVKVIIKK